MINRRTEAKIRKIYAKVFKEVFNKTNTDLMVEGKDEEVLLKIRQLSESKIYKEFCEKFAKELAKEGLSQERGLWRKYFNAAKAAHYIALPKNFEEFETKLYNQMTSENFQMIKSIPEDMLKIMNHKYSETLVEEVIKGKRTRGSFRRELLSHGHKNANLIARTESAKIQTQVLQYRATSLGSVVYEWLSSNDRRTRESHRKMNGVIVFWKQMKPHLDNMYGHAGEFPNCRCSPQPILDEDDLTENTYKVYNYKTEQIVSMTRKELLEKIKEGQL